MGNGLEHILGIGVHRILFLKGEGCSNSLRNALAWNNGDVAFTFEQLFGLLCGKHDVGIVRQNIDMLRRDQVNRIYEIFRARIHGLSARKHGIHPKAFE
ncbi:hypothetical protein D3C74_406350 [compost metagenome]